MYFPYDKDDIVDDVEVSILTERTCHLYKLSLDSKSK